MEILSNCYKSVAVFWGNFALLQSNIFKKCLNFPIDCSIISLHIRFP